MERKNQEVEKMITLYEHQKECLEWLRMQNYMGRTYAALLMDMGTGKTLTILTHLRDNNQLPALIVTKNSIKYNWADEIVKMGGSKQDVIVLDGSTEKKRSLLSTPAKYYILNYESVRLLEPELTQKGFRAMVLDESTAIKNPFAKVSKSVMRIGRVVGYRYILTGTPITNNPLDCYYQFKFLDKNILFFDNYYAFRARYCSLVERNYGGHRFKEVTGYRNLDELVSKIQPHAYIKRKEECLDLPEKIYETRYVELSQQQKQLYKELKTQLVAEISEGREIVVTNILTKLLRLQQLLGGVAVTAEGEKVLITENKTTELLSIIDELGDNKAVIWCRFVEEIKKLEKLLLEKGYKVASIYGETSPADRQEYIRRLNTGDLQFLVCQPQTAGYGLNLIGATYAIYYSNDWSLANRQQSEDRIYRIGQTKRVTIIDLVTKHTVEETIIKALKQKKQFQELFLRSQEKEKIKIILEGGEEHE